MQGEVTIVLEKALHLEGMALSEEKIEAQLRGMIADGVPPSHAARVAAKQLGVPRSSLYETAVRIKGKHA